MTTYVKNDIQRIFDYLKIVNDDLLALHIKLNTKADSLNGNVRSDKIRTYSEKLADAKIKIIEAIELLAEANAIRTK